jgi:hypothetical protein
VSNVASRIGRLLSLACLLAVAAMLCSCAVTKAARYKPLIDTTGLEPGAPRALVESRLGHAVREWDLRSGVHCASYEFELGVLGSATGAIGLAMVDFSTLGIFEGMYAVDHGMSHRLETAGSAYSQRVVVTYDQDGKSLGFFDNYALLPDSGVSGPRHWSHP